LLLKKSSIDYMKKVKVKISWTRATLLKQAGFARGTVIAMKDNNSFLTPDVSLKAMLDAAARVENAWPKREDGVVARDEFDNSSTDLNDKLHTQAAYVDKIANGDANIIHSAGFESTKATNERLRRVAVPHETAAPVIVPETNGQIKVTVNAVEGAKMYCFILVLDGAFNVSIVNGEINIPEGTNAKVINSTKRSVTFQNLPSMKLVRVAVAVYNSTGASALSSVSSGSTII
jgi:hypothetical protein